MPTFEDSEDGLVIRSAAHLTPSVVGIVSARSAVCHDEKHKQQRNEYCSHRYNRLARY